MEPVKKTRSGRIVKQPVRYEPIEKVEDDFSDSDIESHWDSDISSEVSYDPEDVADESSDDDSFIASDSETEENDEIKNESDDVEEDGSDDDSSESVGSS